MVYRPGDYVCPADLPRRFVCKITQAERIDVGSSDSQILIRLDSGVIPAAREEVPAARGRSHGAAVRRPHPTHVPEPSSQRAVG